MSKKTTSLTDELIQNFNARMERMIENSTLLKKCPVCKVGQVAEFKRSMFFYWGRWRVIKCSNCASEFSYEGTQQGMDNVKLRLYKPKMSTAYANQTLCDYEWDRIAKGGKSDAELAKKRK